MPVVRAHFSDFIAPFFIKAGFDFFENTDTHSCKFICRHCHGEIIITRELYESDDFDVLWGFIRDHVCTPIECPYPSPENPTQKEIEEKAEILRKAMESST